MSVRATRRGLTLVELLVVMGLIVFVAAVAIPSVRFLTHDLQVREASRDVQSFMQQVVSDAKLNGNAGFWIERDINAPNTGLAIYRTRRPPAFTGDFSYSTCNILNDPTGTLGLAGGPGLFVDFAVIPNPSIEALLTQWTTGAGSVAPPEIQFEYVGRRYYVSSLIGNTTVSGVVYYRVQLAAFTHETGGLPVGRLNNKKFKIVPPPVKLAARALIMPKDTYIDLGLSGFTSLDIDGDNQADTTGAELAVNFNDPTPGPVVVLLGRNGAVDRVISKNLPGGFPSGQTLYLMIAMDERDQTAVFNEPLDVTSFPAYGTSTFYTNLDNIDNLWLTFGRNGHVSLSENADTTARTSNSIGDSLRAARSIAIDQVQMAND